MQPDWARTSGLGVPRLPLARWVGWVAPVRPTNWVLVLSCPSAALRVCSVLGRLAPVHRCARAVRCVASAVSWATWLLLTGVLARCVVLRVRCPGPLGSRSPVRPLGVLCCVCGVPGPLAPVTGAPARCVALRVRCPGPLGSCSPVCPLGVLCCVCGVLGHLAPVHRCARSVCCCACAVSWATWLLFTGVPARCVVLRVLLLSPRSLPLSFPCSSLFAGLFCFVFFWGGGGLAGPRRFWCCAWVWVCAGAGAGVGVGVVGDEGRVAVALWVPCVCAGPQASGLQGACPGGADSGWLVAVLAWRLRGWSRLLGSVWVAWPGAGVCVGVFMAWADGVVGSVGVAGL